MARRPRLQPLLVMILVNGPHSGKIISIDYTLPDKNGEMEIFNSSYLQVKSIKIKGSKGNFLLNCSKLGEGNFYLRDKEIIRRYQKDPKR